MAKTVVDLVPELIGIEPDILDLTVKEAIPVVIRKYRDSYRNYQLWAVRPTDQRAIDKSWSWVVYYGTLLDILIQLEVGGN